MTFRSNASFFRQLYYTQQVVCRSKAIFWIFSVWVLVVRRDTQGTRRHRPISHSSVTCDHYSVVVWNPNILGSGPGYTGLQLLETVHRTATVPSDQMWKPQLQLEMSTMHAEIQLVVEIGLFTASTSHLCSHWVRSWTRNSYAWESIPRSGIFTRTLTGGPLTSSLFLCSDWDADEVAAGTDSSKLCSDMLAELLSAANHPAICSEQKSYATVRIVTLQ